MALLATRIGSSTTVSKTSLKLEDDTVIVVLGASGDLAKKKTYPALFGLYRSNLLPTDVKVVGYARSKLTRDSFHQQIISHIETPNEETKTLLQKFSSLCTYVDGQYDDDQSFINLESHLQTLEKGQKFNHRLFYMALPPNVFVTVSHHLKKNCYPSNGTARIIIEKPFGKDLQTFLELQAALEPDWKEAELFRIDHYLGKEMVKNILVIRFSNSIFSSVWNRHNISNVQISFKEPFGTEGRGGYFDQFGIIRDVMQNHLLQVLTLIAMERPLSGDEKDIRDEKVKVLRAIPPIQPKNVVIGQYGPSLDGTKQGYKDGSVPDDSQTPTFAAMVAYVNNERWEGVPFFIKAGKALNERKTEVRIQFRDVTAGLFQDISRNELVIRIQPNECVYLKMNSKLPGLAMHTAETELDLSYNKRFDGFKIPEAYEGLILDAIQGDQSNFVRNDELDASWRIFTPLLHHLSEHKHEPIQYPYGSHGLSVLGEFMTSYGYQFAPNDSYQWPVYSNQSHTAPAADAMAALKISEKL